MFSSKSKVKLVAMVLAVLMMASLMPMAAFAAESVGNKPKNPGNNSVIVGDIYMTSFNTSAALKAVALAAAKGLDTNVYQVVTGGANAGFYNLTAAYAIGATLPNRIGAVADPLCQEIFGRVTSVMNLSTKEVTVYDDCEENPDIEPGGGPSVDAEATGGEFDGTTWTIEWADLNPQTQSLAQDVTTLAASTGVTLELKDGWKVSHIAGAYDKDLLIVNTEKTVITVKNELAANAPFEVAAKLVNGEKVAYIGIVINNRAPETLTNAKFTAAAGAPKEYEIPTWGAVIEAETEVTVPDDWKLTVPDSEKLKINGTLIVGPKSQYVGQIFGRDYIDFVGDKGFSITGRTLTINEYAHKMEAGDYIVLDKNDSLVIDAMTDDAILNLRVTSLWPTEAAVFADDAEVEEGATVMIQFYDEDAIEAKDAIVDALLGITGTELEEDSEWAVAVMGDEGWEVDDSEGHPKSEKNAIEELDERFGKLDENRNIINVPAGTKVAELAAAITVSKDATFAILTAATDGEVADPTATVATGMVVEVTAEDGKAVAKYTITVYVKNNIAKLDPAKTLVAGKAIGTFGAQSGKGETTAIEGTVDVPYASRATASFATALTTDSTGATISAYVDNGKGSGTYGDVGTSYDFSGTNNTIWLKVVAEDGVTTTYYKINVTASDKSTVNTIELTEAAIASNKYILDSTTSTLKIAFSLTNRTVADVKAAIQPADGAPALIKIVADITAANAITSTASFNNATEFTGTVTNANKIVVLSESGSVKVYGITVGTAAETGNTITTLTIGGAIATPGTSNADITSALLNGTVDLTAAQAATGGYNVLALFDFASVTKVVKIAAGGTAMTADTFTSANPYVSGPIANGDILYFQVKAEDPTKVNYYKITATITDKMLVLTGDTKTTLAGVALTSVGGSTGTGTTGASAFEYTAAIPAASKATAAFAHVLTTGFTGATVTAVVKASAPTQDAEYLAVTASYNLSAVGATLWVKVATTVPEKTEYYKITVTDPIAQTGAELTTAATVAGQAISSPAGSGTLAAPSAASVTIPNTLKAAAVFEKALGSTSTNATVKAVVKTGTDVPTDGEFVDLAQSYDFSGTTPALWVKVTPESTAGTALYYKIAVTVAPLMTDALLDGASDLGEGDITFNLTSKTGANEANAKTGTVTVPYANRATAVFVPAFGATSKYATVTAYADNGNGGGTYKALTALTTYDFSSTNNTLWVKVVSEDTLTTLYYKITVTIAAAGGDPELTSASLAGGEEITFGKQAGLGEPSAKTAVVVLPSTGKNAVAFAATAEPEYTVTAYLGTEAGGGKYVAPATTYDFTGTNKILWIKVANADGSKAAYYKIIVADLPAGEYTVDASGESSTTAKIATTTVTIDSIPYSIAGNSVAALIGGLIATDTFKVDANGDIYDIEVKQRTSGSTSSLDLANYTGDIVIRGASAPASAITVTNSEASATISVTDDNVIFDGLNEALVTITDAKTVTYDTDKTFLAGSGGASDATVQQTADNAFTLGGGETITVAELDDGDIVTLGSDTEGLLTIEGMTFTSDNDEGDETSNTVTIGDGDPFDYAIGGTGEVTVGTPGTSKFALAATTTTLKLGDITFVSNGAENTVQLNTEYKIGGTGTVTVGGTLTGSEVFKLLVNTAKVKIGGNTFEGTGDVTYTNSTAYVIAATIEKVTVVENGLTISTAGPVEVNIVALTSTGNTVKVTTTGTEAITFVAGANITNNLSTTGVYIGTNGSTTGDKKYVASGGSTNAMSASGTGSSPNFVLTGEAGVTFTITYTVI